MSFLAICLALVLDRLLNDYSTWRQRQIYADFLQWLHDRLEGIDSLKGMPAAIISVSIGPLLLSSVLSWFDDSGFIGQAFLVLLSAAILFWAISWRELSDGIDAMMRSLDGTDADDIQRRANDIDCPLSAPPLPTDDANTLPQASPQERQRADILLCTLAQAGERLFAPLFWFIVLGGPIGVLFYLGVALSNQAQSANDQPNNPFQALKHWLDWLPARLQAAAYSLVGSFDSTLTAWRNHGIHCLGRFQDENTALTVCTGLGALGHDHNFLQQHANTNDPNIATPSAISTQDNLAALQLISRSLIVWLAIVATLSLNGILL